jgi:hypothetical protein
VLLLAFVCLVREQRTRNSPTARALAIWLVFTIVFYHNNFVNRPITVETATGEETRIFYEDQLREQCGRADPMLLTIYGGPVWCFQLDQRQIERLCADSF